MGRRSFRAFREKRLEIIDDGAAVEFPEIIFRLWQDKTVYREETYEAALKKTNSSLVARLDHIEVGKSPFKSPLKKN